MRKNWTQAELDCIKAARQSNIRLKIIADALGRSALSIHKRLMRLKPLAQKGKLKPLINKKRSGLKPENEFHKMEAIIKRYCPKQETQKMQKCFYSSVWTKEQLPQNLHKCEKTHQGHMKKVYIHIDSQGFTKLLFGKLIDIDEKSKQGKIFQDLLNVPLTLIEYWAKEEGVHFVKQPNIHFDYVINEQYLTLDQFILYINKYRVEQLLLPFQISDKGKKRT